MRFLAWDPGLCKRPREHSTDLHLSLLPDVGFNVASCLKLLKLASPAAIESENGDVSIFQDLLSKQQEEKLRQHPREQCLCQ